MNPLVLDKHASLFRAQNGYSNKESIHLKSLLHKLGVLAVFRPLEMEISGMAMKVGPDNRFMLINTARTLGHQHFTICHELYHLFIQADFVYHFCQVGIFDKKDKEEYNADLFASRFLMPKEGIMALISDREIEESTISLATILKIEQYFSCSRSALLYRMQDLGLIKTQQLEAFKFSVRRSAMDHGYSLKLYEKDNQEEVIGNYGDIARKLFEKGAISESHYYSMLEDLGVDFSVLLKNGDEEGG